jgi:hypothetical protein
MNITIEKDLILRLIRDSLINYKLVSGLNAMGLNADDYHIYLSDTVFKLMGLDKRKDGDLLFEKIYLGNAQKVRQISIMYSTAALDQLSGEIYEELLLAKGMVEGITSS